MPAAKHDSERRWGRMKPLRHGVLLRDAREHAKMTPREVCQRTQMSAAHLSDLERGISTLSLTRARQLASTYGVDAAPILEAIFQDRLDEAGMTDVRVIVTVSSR